MAMTASGYLARLINGVVLIGMVTLVVRIIAFGREAMTAAVFGISGPLDLFLVSFLVPSFLILSITGCAGASLIPVLMQARETGGGVRALIARVNGSALVIFVCLAALIAILAPFYLPLLARHLNPEQAALAGRWSVMLCLLIPVYGFVAIWMAIANSRGHLASAAAVPAITPLTIIAMLLTLTGGDGGRALVIGWMLGAVLELTAIGLVLYRHDLLIWPKPAFEWAGDFARNFAAMFASTAIFLLIPLADQAMATMAGPGGIARITFGGRLATLLVSIGSVALGYSALPVFSALAAAGDWRQLSKLLTRAVGLVLALSIPACLLLAWFSPWIVRIAFQHGNFSAAETLPIAAVQALYVLQNPFYLCWILLNSALVAMRRRLPLVIMSAFAAILNAVLNLWWLPDFGVRGIAAATTITMLVLFVLGCGVTYRSLNSRISGSQAGLNG